VTDKHVKHFLDKEIFIHKINQFSLYKSFEMYRVLASTYYNATEQWVQQIQPVLD